MAKGISLHVGINQLSPDFPNAAPLFGCENDARAMHDLATLQGFYKHALLLGQDATYDRVRQEIEAAASELDGGDFFLFTFAGHGSGIPDDPAPFGDEPDHQDETILLFDRMLIDDVMGHDLWPRFRPGVRVLVVSDSCQSGTVAAEEEVVTATEVVTAAGVVASLGASEHLVVSDLAVAVTTEVRVSASVVTPTRAVSEETMLSHLASNHEFYANALSAIPPMVGGASVLLLAACQDNESTPDALPDDPDPHGAFTRALLNVWNGGAFNDYEGFIAAVGDELKVKMGLLQTPVITPKRPDNEAFRAQRPFVI